MAPATLACWLGSNWVKLGSFSFFEKVEIGEIVNV
jgi:hypothetical protein